MVVRCIIGTCFLTVVGSIMASEGFSSSSVCQFQSKKRPQPLTFTFRTNAATPNNTAKSSHASPNSSSNKGLASEVIVSPDSNNAFKTIICEIRDIKNQTRQDNVNVAYQLLNIGNTLDRLQYNEGIHIQRIRQVSEAQSILSEELQKYIGLLTQCLHTLHLLAAQKEIDLLRQKGSDIVPAKQCQPAQQYQTETSALQSSVAPAQ